MASVSIASVNKSFGSHPVIKDVSVEIADGEFVILVGPSGCGKSTLLRIIAGLETINSGTLAIGDRRVNDVEPKDRDIAMVFQNYALYPHMTVAANMAFSLVQRGRRQGGGRAARPRSRCHPGDRTVARPLSQAALGWPASARRHGPRHRPQSQGVPVRRTAQQSRRQAAGADARRDQGAAPPPRHHHDLRDARPDRSHDHGRPHRRAAPTARSNRSAVRSTFTTIRSTCSSPGFLGSNGMAFFRGNYRDGQFVSTDGLKLPFRPREAILRGVTWSAASARMISSSPMTASTPRSTWSSRPARKPRCWPAGAARNSPRCFAAASLLPPGSSVRLGIAPDRAHVFDAASGLRLDGQSPLHA